MPEGVEDGVGTLNAGLTNLTIMFASCETGTWSVILRLSTAIDFVLWIEIRCVKEWVVYLT